MDGSPVCILRFDCHDFARDLDPSRGAGCGGFTILLALCFPFGPRVDLSQETSQERFLLLADVSILD